MKLLHALTVLIIVTGTGCQKDTENNSPKSTVVVHFTNTVNGNPLSLFKTYTNSVHEEFTLTKFKYYISNISLKGTDKTENIPDTYFLVDQSNFSSQRLELQADARTFTGISFLIGVDSLRNVSGAQTGALDPANDMFWTWNTGYIMAKMEGTSPASTVVNKKIEYHIGGFKGEDNVLRKVILNFSQPYSLTEGKSLNIFINAEVMDWFAQSRILSITEYPVCTMPGALASRFADNYAQMFTLSSVSVQ